MSKKNLFEFVARLLLIGAAVVYAGGVHSAENENANVEEKEDLDVTLNRVYISARIHGNNNVQSEVLLQIPFPLTKQAEQTGLGPIGSVVFFDNKELVRNKKIDPSGKFLTQNDSATVRGLGRLHYVYSAYETTHTFIPYLTFYRELLISFADAGRQVQGKSKAWIVPGTEYAYRMNDEVVLHLDAELYSYSQPLNNMARVGASYVLSEKWLASAGVERLAWNMEDTANKSIFMNGVSNNIYVKLLNSNPLRNNVSVILGYAADRNTVGLGGLQSVRPTSRSGLFWGAELSFGTLAW